MHGYNSPFENNNFFDTLGDKISQWVQKYPTASIISGGNLSTVMDNTVDRWPPRNTPVNSRLRGLNDSFNLTDIWRDRFHFIDYWLSSSASLIP